MATSVQPTLMCSDWFQPMLGGRGHYVACLQSLPGELAALKNASDQTWAHLTPLMRVRGPKKQRTDPFRQETVSAWIKKISPAVDGHPWFLDTLRLTATHPTATKHGDQPLLSVIHAVARKRGLKFVPVLNLNSGAKETRIIRDSCLVDGRGIALRCRPQTLALPSGQTFKGVFQEKLASVEADFLGTDLLIDLGFMSMDEETVPEDLAAMIEELTESGNWRNVVLLGTSMPSSLGGGVVKEGTVGRIPRQEWTLWSALGEAGLTRMPSFGDYAIQHPNPPAEGQNSGPGMRANIRYTTDEVTLVPRGTGPVITEGREQYRGLCRELTALQEYAGPNFTWGDYIIADCASGTGEPGSQEQWRAVGTSHHLRHVVEQLDRTLT